MEKVATWCKRQKRSPCPLREEALAEALAVEALSRSTKA
jgi:hypothetical protein